tara:strand:+ start:908 stop:1567 length:660 start_codon:yes stop_codon:yes gene_type:complete
MIQDSTILTDPYIYVIDNVISQDNCMDIITKFDNDTNQRQGSTANGVETHVKNSMDIAISNYPSWKKEDLLFKQIISTGHENYYRHLNSGNHFTSFVTSEKCHIFSPYHSENLELLDTGYQIQKTEAGKGYTWHDDFSRYGNTTCTRYLTFILYLNTVEEGWTQFYNGDQVSPQVGRLVFFPATWTYVHQGYPPKQTKYIMTGWMHTQSEPPEKENGKN